MSASAKLTYVDEAKHTRLASVVFVNSVPFGSENTSCQVGRNCDSMVIARLDADGAALPIDKGQRSDGLLLQARRHDRVKNRHYTEQVFVPWANVRALGYGE